MALGTPLTEAFVRLRVDDSAVDNDAREAGTKAGRSFGSNFDRNADTHGVRKTGTGMTTALPASASTAGKESGKRFGSAFSGAVKGLLVTGAAYFGTQQVIDFLKTSTDEAREAEKVGSRTSNVIKSTGGAAGVTAKQVSDLAQALSNKVGQDDEAIQSGANLLLTFKNLRDEQGKGNDIFSQTTGLMVDMSTAMDQDMKSSAIQLGKALNDPTKGMSALQRVGVTFNDQQEKEIKHLQKTHHLMGAQKIILHELKSEFGGAGKAMADPADRARVAWANFEEDLGTKMMPTLNDLADWFVDKGLPKIRRFGRWFEKEGLPDIKHWWAQNGDDLTAFGKSIGNLAVDLGPVAKDALPALADSLGYVADAIGSIASQYNKLPEGLQKLLVTGAVVAYGGKKLGAGKLLAGGAAAGGAAAAGGGAAAGAGVAGAGTAAAEALPLFTRLTNSPLMRRAGWVGLALGTYDAAKQIDGLNVNTDHLGRNVQRIKAQLEDSAIGDYASDIGINIDRLAKSLATQGSKGEYAQEVMRKLQVRGENLGESFFREVVNPFKMQNDKLDQARFAYNQLVPAIDKTINRQKANAAETRSTNQAATALFQLFRSNLIPSTANLADKYDLTRKDARSLRSAISDTTGTAKEHEAQLRDVADKLGLDRQQTRDLIKAYGDIPKRVDTTANFFTREAANARDQFLRDTKGKFSDLGNDTYAIMVNGQSGHGRLFQANGGIVNFADGGHFAQIAKPGTTRIWNEPETGGESYIPLHPSKRQRSLGIWAETGRRLGVDGFADGGIAGRVNTAVHADFSQLRQLVRETVKSLRSLGGSVPATLAWAKRQVGDSYLMGGTGPNQWDCSGFMSGITHHLLGQNPVGSRLFATSSFPTSMFSRGPGIFMIGSTRDAGDGIGHMAGTLGGVNVESRGGEGVVVGPNARGAHDPLFGGNIWHLKQGLIKQVIAGGRGDPASLSATGFNRWERYILGHESLGAGGRFANNPTSTAFGLGQLTESNRIAAARALGFNWHQEVGDTGTTDRAKQIEMFRWYVDSRYGSSKAAAAFKRAHGWYGDGLEGGIFTKPTLIGVGERGPERVDVTPLDNTQRLARAMSNRGNGPMRLQGQVELDLGEGLKLRGLMRGIARDEVDSSAEFEATTNRMGRR